MPRGRGHKAGDLEPEKAKFPKVAMEAMEPPLVVEEGDGCGHSVFLNVVVMREIMAFIGVTDLLSCSLVSRVWNSQAREVLRESGKCYAAIKDIAGGGGRAVAHVIALEALVRNTVNSPFSGLSVRVYKRKYVPGYGGCISGLGHEEHYMENSASEESDVEEEEEEDSSSEELHDDSESSVDSSSSRSSLPSVPKKKKIKDESAVVLGEDAIKALSSILTLLGPDIKFLKLSSEALLPERLINGSQHFRPLPQNLKLAMLILKSLAPTLEGILVDLQYDSDFNELFGLDDIRGLKLPNLKTLEIYPNETRLNSDHGSLIKELVTASPNLQNLIVDVPPCLLMDLLPLARTRSVGPVPIQQYDFYPSLVDLDTSQQLFLLTEPKLKKLTFSTEYEDDDDIATIYTWLPKHQQRFCETLNALLQSSANSLEMLSIEHLDLFLLLTRWDPPTLSGLKRLELFYYLAIDKCAAYGNCTLTKIDFTHYFPHLREVCIVDSRNGRSDPLDFYMSDEFKQQKRTFACFTVTSLRYQFDRSGSNTQKLNMCQRLFPNVKHFQMELPDTTKASFPARLWTAWPDLQSLSLSSLVLHEHNFDESFLGVSKKDGVRIMSGELDDDFDLELLQIVPVRPSIFNLQKLQRISFGLLHGGTCYPSGYPRRKFYDPVFLSLPALRLIRCRMPQLRIELEREVCLFKDRCHLSLKYLKPHIDSMSSVQLPKECDIQRPLSFNYRGLEYQECEEDEKTP